MFLKRASVHSRTIRFHALPAVLFASCPHSVPRFGVTGSLLLTVFAVVSPDQIIIAQVTVAFHLHSFEAPFKRICLPLITLVNRFLYY